MSKSVPFKAPNDFLVTDGGIETTLHFKKGFPLRHEAAFEALYSDKWHKVLQEEAEQYARNCLVQGISCYLDTHTWRASKKWLDDLEIPGDNREKEITEKSVDLLNKVREKVLQETGSKGQIYICGAVGPRGDAYARDETVNIEVAREYHRPLINALADAGVDFIGAYTLTSSAEAAAVALEAAERGITCMISFTIESDQRLSSGESLEEAIQRVDECTGDSKPEYYIVNCIHPMHMRPILEDARQRQQSWLTERFLGLKANGSALSHEDLDNSETIDEGDPEQWALDMLQLQKDFPCMKILGGCCGTGTVHQLELVKAISASK